ncbi:MAG: sterol carrier protein domain-containing protein, partial [Roseiflexaceae bacterium]
AQAALQLWSRISLTASKSSKHTPLAGVVDLPLLLAALVPEFERRLARSRYAGWSGNLRLEIDTERITLAFADGGATVIDGSRPADLRLRQITLPALAQLCLGYRVAADLRATGGLACDDSALGLLDALFPAILAVGTSVTG